jgi:hypothetical protein
MFTLHVPNVILLVRNAALHEHRSAPIQEMAELDDQDPLPAGHHGISNRLKANSMSGAPKAKAKATAKPKAKAKATITKTTTKTTTTTTTSTRAARPLKMTRKCVHSRAWHAAKLLTGCKALRAKVINCHVLPSCVFSVMCMYLDRFAYDMCGSNASTYHPRTSVFFIS